MTENIIDHGITEEENNALGLLPDIDDANEYIEHSSDDKKTLDLAILYLYRLQLGKFLSYLSKVEDKRILDDSDEMIEEAFRYKFARKE